MTTEDWRTTALLREALLNTLGRGSRQNVIASVAIALGLASALGSTFVENELRRDDLARERAGYGVLQIGSTSDSDEARISRTSCEALTSRDGVRRAGVIIPLDRVAFVQTGAAHVALVSTTLLPALVEVDAVVGRDLVGDGAMGFPGSAGVGVPARGVEGADEARTAAGGEAPWWLASADGAVSARVGGVEPAGIGLGSVISFALPADVDEAPVCIVEVAPTLIGGATAGDVTSEIIAGLETEGPDVGAFPVETGGTSLREVWSGSPARAFPVGAGVVGALIAGLVLVLRSSEIAAYRLSGTSARSLLRLLFFEQAVLAGCLVSAAGVGFAMLACVGAAVSPSGLHWALLSGVAWLVVVGVPAFVTASRNPVRLARDR
jgi:hypothetical protein